jgi:hypothetical protein
MRLIGLNVVVLGWLTGCSDKPTDTSTEKQRTRINLNSGEHTLDEPSVLDLLTIFAEEEQWGATREQLERAIDEPIKQAMEIIEKQPPVIPERHTVEWPPIFKKSLKLILRELRWSIGTTRSGRDADAKYFSRPLSRRRETFSDPLTRLLAAAKLIIQTAARPDLMDEYIPELCPMLERDRMMEADLQGPNKKGTVSTKFYPLVALCMASGPQQATNCYIQALEIRAGHKIIDNRSFHAEKNRMMKTIVNCARFEVTLTGNDPSILKKDIDYQRHVKLADLYSGVMPRGLKDLEARDHKATTEICH